MSSRLQEANLWMLVNPGNHENYDWIESQPLDDGMIVLGSRLRALPRGHRWEMRGRRFGAAGGAYSIDRLSRTRGSSW